MIRRFAIAVLAVAVTAFVAAPAQAGGGGGTKRTVSVKTSNDSGVPLVVFGTKSTTGLPTTVKQAKNKFGGVVIADGATKTVMVPSGKAALIAVPFDEVTGELEPPPGVGEYNLNAGAKTTALIVEDTGLDVLIPKPFAPL